MVNFFRKKRKKLANDNRALKYTRYAIGEILLVVIGILIALQINTWNQERLARIDEKTILKNLHREFLQNKTILNECIIMNKQTFVHANTIMNYFGMKKELLSSKNLDSIIFHTFEHEPFFPSEHALHDLIQSGRLQLLQNNKLKEELHNWTSTKGLANESFEGIDQKVERDILPYLTSRYPLKDMDSYGPLNWKHNSVLKIDKHQIFYDISFENLIDDLLYRTNEYMVNLIKLQEIIDEILIQTKNNN